MKNLEILYKELFVNTNGEKKIKLPIYVIKPDTYKEGEGQLAEAAGISAEDISALLRKEVVLDVETGKVCAGEVSDKKLTSILAVEWLLKEHSPQAVEKYMMRELPVHSDDKLCDYYERILNRASRYARLIELGAPYLIIYDEARMLQDAVNALYSGCSTEEQNSPEAKQESQQDKIRLRDIIAKGNNAQ